MYTVHGRGAADLPFFCVSATVDLILVQINLLDSQAQPYGICTRFFKKNNLYVEHHTEK